MDFNKINSVYFLGIGGIGMSALARYFLMRGKVVGGYDLTSTPLTNELLEQGIEIHFQDDIDLIPESFRQKETTLVVLTPAIPEDNYELTHFQIEDFTIVKRAEILGHIFNDHKGIAVAGTHGKTSVSTFTSYLLEESGIGCSAFLGGISKNFNSNLVVSDSEYVVAEADEFDRSFLQLFPKVLLITTVDEDHLDIYKDIEDISAAFNKLLSQVQSGGTIILNQNVRLTISGNVKVLTYSLENTQSDYYASGIQIKNGEFHFNLNTPDGIIEELSIEVPGKINVENAIGALAISLELGANREKIKAILPNLKGVVRRFDIKYKSDKRVYIDDYAHHPRELDAVISSVRELYPGKKITAIFQPHLYSRTKDFADEFAESLSRLDELVLLEIYPAREKPIPGITSEVIFEGVKIKNKQRCSKVNLLSTLKGLNIEVLLTLGAGDIDQYVDLIKQYCILSEEA